MSLVVRVEVTNQSGVNRLLSREQVCGRVQPRNVGERFAATLRDMLHQHGFKARITVDRHAVATSKPAGLQTKQAGEQALPHRDHSRA